MPDQISTSLMFGRAMSQVARCSQCSHEFTVNEFMGGGEIACPKCGSAVRHTNQSGFPDDIPPMDDLSAGIESPFPADPFAADPFAETAPPGSPVSGSVPVVDGEQDFAALDFDAIPSAAFAQQPLPSAQPASSSGNFPIAPTSPSQSGDPPGTGKPQSRSKASDDGAESKPKIPVPVIAAAAGIPVLLLVAGLVYFFVFAGSSDKSAQKQTPDASPSDASPSDAAAVAVAGTDSVIDDDGGASELTDPAASPIDDGQQHYPWDPAEQKLAYSIDQTPDVSIVPAGIQDPTIIQNFERLRDRTVVVEVRANSRDKSTRKSLSGLVVNQSKQGTLFVTDAQSLSDVDRARENLICLAYSGTEKGFTPTSNMDSIDPSTGIMVVYSQWNSKDDQETGLDFNKVPEIGPGQHVYVIGHAKESGKRYGHKGPPLQLAAGTLDKTTNDKSGEPIIRVSDAVHSLNVGGPVVSEKGQLLGVAASDPSGSGYRLITLGQLQKTLRGSLQKLSLAKVKEFGNGTAYRVEAAVTDPRRKLKSIQVLAFDKSEQTVTEPGVDGVWQQAANKLLTRVSTPVSLSRGLLRPVRFGSDLVIQADEDTTQLQARLEYHDGSITFSEPAALPNIERFQLSESESRKTSNSVADDHAFQELLMPQLASAIELRPDNGDALGLGALKNEVFLMRADMIESGDFSAAPVLTLDGPPLLAVFKRFDDRNFWIVAISGSKKLHVINADSFEVAGGIETGISRFYQNTSISVSSNPQDPFVYYSSASDDFAGAVNLRTMSDIGQIGVRSKQFKIFADGKSAIGIVSSSLQRWELTSTLTTDTPEFSPRNRLSRTYFPLSLDPHGQYVFAGSNVLSRDLTKSVATLPTSTSMVFSKWPIVGIAGDKRYNRVDLDTLKFVSYNNFESIDVSAKLPKKLAETRVELTSEQRRQVDGGIQFQTSFFADEENDRLLAAIGDRLYTLSISDLGLPQSPFLTLASPTNAAARVGLKNRIPVSPKSPGVEVTVPNPLPGMTFTDGAIQWVPTSQDVGLKSIPVQLSGGGAQKTIELTIDVAQPHLKSPIKIAGVKMSDSGSFCVAWSGPKKDQYGRIVRVDGQESGVSLALIPLRPGFESKQTAVPYQIRDAILIGSKIVLQPTEGASRVEVYDLKTLERIKTLLSASQLLKISLDGDALVLQGSKSVDRYSTRTFARLKADDPTQSANTRQYPRSSSQSAGLLRDGTLEDGILLDTANKRPMLFVRPNQIPVVGAMDSQLSSGSFLRRVSPPVDPANARSGRQNIGMVGPKVMPGRGWQVSLWPSDERIEYKVLDSRSYAMKMALTLVVVDQEGTLLGRYPIAEQLRDSSVPADQAFLEATKDAVYVMMGDKIYRWSATEGQTTLKNKSTEEEELHFVPRQDEFVMRSRDGKFRHQLVGGKAPYEFFLVTRSEAVTLDETDGTVKIDRDIVFDLAMPILRARLRRAQTPDAQMVLLQQMAVQTAAQYQNLTGSTPRGLPIALPIHLKAVDAEGTVAQIQYCVLVDLPVKQIISSLNTSP